MEKIRTHWNIVSQISVSQSVRPSNRQSILSFSIQSIIDDNEYVKPIFRRRCWVNILKCNSARMSAYAWLPLDKESFCNPVAITRITGCTYVTEYSLLSLSLGTKHDVHVHSLRYKLNSFLFCKRCHVFSRPTKPKGPAGGISVYKIILYVPFVLQDLFIFSPKGVQLFKQFPRLFRVWASESLLFLAFVGTLVMSFIFQIFLFALWSIML